MEIWLRSGSDAGMQSALELLGVFNEEGGLIPGVGLKVWAVGSISDGRGEGGALNAEVWANLLFFTPIDADWVAQARATFRAGSSPDTKPSENGNGASQWSTRAEGSMFEQSWNGNAHPEHRRMTWAT